MSLEFVNKICPKCKNPNYMVSLGDFSTAYKYKCMNCNGYFNDIDFNESSQFDELTDHMNKKTDMVEVVRCKDCLHRSENHRCYADNPMRGQYVGNDWFCADGERW